MDESLPPPTTDVGLGPYESSEPALPMITDTEVTAPATPEPMDTDDKRDAADTSSDSSSGSSSDSSSNSSSDSSSESESDPESTTIVVSSSTESDHSYKHDDDKENADEVTEPDSTEAPLPEEPSNGFEIQDSPYPHHIQKLLTHPYTRYYREDPDNLPEDPAARLAAKVTLGDLHNFRNASLDWSLIQAEKKPQPVGVIFKNMKTSNFSPNAPFALYSVHSSSGFATTLIPVHPELVARDRPDLHAVQLSPHSKDILNEGPPHAANLFPGDIIAVLQMRRRIGAEPDSLKVDLLSVLNLPSHKFWLVTEYFVLPRYIEKRVPAIVQSIRPKVQCVATNVTSFVQVRKAVLDHQPELFREEGNLLVADVFVPTVFPGTFIRGQKRGASAQIVVTQTDIHQYGQRPQPSIIKVSKMAKEQEDEFKAAPNVFATFKKDHKRALQALIASNLLGMSAAAAATNKDKDYRTYATIVDEVSHTERSELLRFSISHSSGIPSLDQWIRSAPFYIKHQGASYLMEVENSEVDYHEFDDDHKIIILAKPQTSDHHHSETLRRMGGDGILVYQKPEDSEQLFRLFPSLEELEEIPLDSPGMKLIHAIFGGDQIPDRKAPAGRVPINGTTHTLSPHQMDYVWKLVMQSTPGLVANCPFGTGKSLMAVAAASASAQQNPDADSINIICANTNAATTSLHHSYRNLVPENPEKAVRLITADNRRKIESQYRTKIDLPVLWPRVFKSYIMAIDRRTRENDQVSDLTKSAIFHMVHHSQLRKCELESPRLQRIVADANMMKPSWEVVEIFMELYKPKIVIGTVNSICEFFNKGPFSNWKKGVVTLQVDEASQLPTNALITLVALFWRANTTLIGDHRQLPPYADPITLDRCYDYTVGAMLKEAWIKKSIPAVNLREVYRCPPQITYLCSEMFYGSRALISTRQPEDYNRFNQALGIDSSFPIQILALSQSRQSDAGRSLVNHDEVELAVKIARRIHDKTGTMSIGIICYYKAQAGLVSSRLSTLPIYVGTIDGSQGQEFDVTIILTTKTTPFSNTFLQSESRLNVAVSRTKEACFVILSPDNAKRSDLWHDFGRRVTTDNITEGKHIIRYLQGPRKGNRRYPRH